MGHIDHRGAQPLVESLDLRAHLDAQLGIQIRQRLVEQEDRRVAHDGPAHGDTLPLPAREMARQAVEQPGQAEDLRRGPHLPEDLLWPRLLQLQGEGHVLGHRHVRIERVVLEHHRDVAILGRHVVHHARADADRAARDGLQPGDHAQQSGLAAARRADEDDEGAVGDVDGHPVHHRMGAIGLADIADGDGCHFRSLSFFVFSARR